ncbi:sugar ABC transporter substrate-binding protein [Blastococcus tunisiensis]|uniref:Monosaccharide ABC transporter substrate-binding protein, CUT2 family n=1 Tax=Blastococcus tunisiensis TaxID=1798228 RepID=A0A1I2MS01_9ACTN|nr:substrate-binding domain-containing protein [Blastococcus sp. DSM 46838]SFF93479.1 monosaccharide ABC transporter substrate-binding protein, CUT2 family [Blastococcus sp. DSM 46838]
MTRSIRRLGVTAVLTLVATVGLAACGSSDEDTSSSGSSGSPAGESSAATQDLLQVAYEGQMGEPPTTPTTPAEDVDLWVVSCGEQIPSCSTPTAAVQEAAEAVGWSARLCDGKLNPNGWGDCVRQAVSAGADVVIPVGIDCASIQQPFQEAKDAGVTVVGAGGADCDAVGGEPLWASERLQLEGMSVKESFELQGKLAADWLIGKTDGQAQVLHLVFTDPLWGPWLAEGFEKEIATCDGCEIVGTLEVANNDVMTGALPQKFSTALLQAPDVNSVFVPLGGWMPAGLAQAVVASGRSAELNVISGLGSVANMELIRNDGGQDAIVGYPTPWGGWGSVDTAIRVLNGEEPLVQGDGFRVVDAENGLPPQGQDFEPVDFRAAYQEAWGV